VRGYYQAMVESRIPFNLADERQLEPDEISSITGFSCCPMSLPCRTSNAPNWRDYLEKGGAIVRRPTKLHCMTSGGEAPRQFRARRISVAIAIAGKNRPVGVRNSYLTVRGAIL